MDNRARILETALQLFTGRGYDAIGVQEICETAGVTKPTLYHYFGNKRGLLDILVEERCAPLISDLAAAAAYGGDLPLSLQRVVEACFSFAAREPLLYRLLLGLWFAAPEHDAYQVVAALHEREHHILEDMFLAASKDHGNMRGKEQTYAATFLGMINNYVGLFLNGYLELDPAAERQAVRQFSYGIYS